MKPEELTQQLYELVIKEKERERERVLMEDEKKEIYDNLREWVIREMEKEKEEMVMFYRQLNEMKKEIREGYPEMP